MRASHQLLAFVILGLTSCASIDVVPLKVDGTKLGDAQVEGVRYYMPKPYLLVTELPVAPQGSSPGNTQAAAAPGGGGGGGGGNTSANNSQSSQTQPQTAAPASAPADTSFSATMASYAVKLIYLPDLSQPMALQIHSGLFGTTSTAPTLQDGWMLTSLSGSVDSGGAAVLSALTGLGTSTASGGAGAAAKGGAAAAAAAPPGDQSLLPHSMNSNNPQSLKNYSPAQLVQYGQSAGMGSLPMPNASELSGLSAAQMQLFFTAVVAGQRAAPTPSTPTVTWGSAVLPPGLYRFDYDATGKLSALAPIEYFCANLPPQTALPATGCTH